MNSTLSLEKILTDQITRLHELKLTTILLDHRKALKEQLLAVNVEMDIMTNRVTVMANDLEKIKAQNAYYRKLILLLKELDEDIVHMSENLPAEFEQSSKQSNEEDSPCMKNFDEPSTAISEYGSVQNRMVKKMSNLNLNTPESGIDDCKKTLFKSRDDAYIMDPLSEDEFSRIPKYMIGRQSLATLNEFVATINSILEAKYSLLALGKAGARKKGKLDLYLSIKREEMIVAPGEDPIYFFMAEDYQRHTQSKLDKTKLNLLTVLRHCKRLRELRVGRKLQYVLVSARERRKSGMF